MRKAGLSAPEPLPRDPGEAVFSLRCKPASHVAVNSAALVAGSLLLAILFPPGGALFPCMEAILVAFLAGDELVWRLRGVRGVDVGRDFFLVHRGGRGGTRSFEKSEIGDIVILGQGGRRVLHVLTGGRILRLPGMRLVTGPRVSISEDAFSRADFDALVAALEVLGGAKALVFST